MLAYTVPLYVKTKRLTTFWKEDPFPLTGSMLCRPRFANVTRAERGPNATRLECFSKTHAITTRHEELPSYQSMLFHLDWCMRRKHMAETRTAAVRLLQPNLL